MSPTPLHMLADTIGDGPALCVAVVVVLAFGFLACAVARGRA